ncbi:MAG: GNAT family N-acetyltransferase [Mycobacteriales bacterium]
MTLEVRAAVAGEGRQIEAIRIAGWRDAYVGLFDAEWLDALAVTDERVAWWDQQLSEPAAGTHVIVAKDDGTVRGFAVVRPCPDDDLPDAGYLAGLYVEPGHQRNGLGSALLAAGLALLTQSECALWVLEGNHPARRFYEQHGFAADGARDVLTRGNTAAPEVRYRRSLG